MSRCTAGFTSALRCPTPLSRTRRAPGQARATAAPCAKGTYRSSTSCNTRPGSRSPDATRFVASPSTVPKRRSSNAIAPAMRGFRQSHLLASQSNEVASVVRGRDEHGTLRGEAATERKQRRSGTKRMTDHGDDGANRAGDIECCGRHLRQRRSRTRRTSMRLVVERDHAEPRGAERRGERREVERAPLPPVHEQHARRRARGVRGEGLVAGSHAPRGADRLRAVRSLACRRGEPVENESIDRGRSDRTEGPQRRALKGQ